MIVHFYAAVHAAEIVYFYGLENARSAFGQGAEDGRWLEVAERAAREQSYGSALPVCPQCGEPWDPRQYRPDTPQIFCSFCKAELVQPAAAAP